MVTVWSALMMQDPLLRNDAREAMGFSKEVMHALQHGGGGMALWPAGSLTSVDVECDWDRISKIGARQSTRN